MAEVTAVAILVLILIGMNYALALLIPYLPSIQCPSVDTSYNNTNETAGMADINDIVLAKCSGMPIWYYLINLALVSGIIYAVYPFK